MGDLVQSLLGIRETGQGLAPFGLRHGGNGVKGLGFFGPLQTADGNVMTEFSVDDESGQYPMVVPTLTRAELGSLLAGQEPTEAMYMKARAFADKRRAAGLSPFIGEGELRYPVPTD